MLILATDQPKFIPQATKSRLQEVVFDLYEMEELREILEGHVSKNGFPYKAQAITCIAVAGKGNPRRAIRIADGIKCFASADANVSVRTENCRDYFTAHEIDMESGLDAIDVRLLEKLHSSKRPVSIRTLSLSIGRDIHSLATEVEPYLIRRQYLDIVPPMGRAITELGLQTLERIKNANSEGRQTPEKADTSGI